MKVSPFRYAFRQPFINPDRGSRVGLFLDQWHRPRTVQPQWDTDRHGGSRDQKRGYIRMQNEHMLMLMDFSFKDPVVQVRVRCIMKTSTQKTACTKSVRALWVGHYAEEDQQWLQAIKPQDVKQQHLFLSNVASTCVHDCRDARTVWAKSKHRKSSKERYLINILPSNGRESNIALPKTDKCLSSPSHFSSFFTV